MTPEPAVPARRRQCGCSLALLLQRELVAAVLVAIVYCHGPGLFIISRPASSSRAAVDAFFGSLSPSPRPAAKKTRPEEVEPAVVVGETATTATCATVERMGEEAAAGRGSAEAAGLRVRELIRRHFEIHGAARVRAHPPHEFCKQGFVLGKASEAGFGNEMYRILTAAALSVMLNRSLIIDQTRGLYPFGQYVSYTNHSFTLEEIKHLWRKHCCATKYGRDLSMRVDNFEHPSETNVLCSDWSSWKDPIIRFSGTTDSVGTQFFLKNVHPGMKAAASALFGLPDSLHARPNTFGELMRAIVSPSRTVHEAVTWALKGVDPDIALHMRMLSSRPVEARQAAASCIKRAIQICHIQGTPRVALVSDTPSFVQDIKSDISEFAEVIYFDYEFFANSSNLLFGNDMPLDFRLRDWGPAPRWAAIVDFFLASRARYAVITGAHPRVGTTYAQLIGALAAANTYGCISLLKISMVRDFPQMPGPPNRACNLIFSYFIPDWKPSGVNFTFLSSIHSSLLVRGLLTQVGRSHIWDTFAGPLSCEHQPHQCAVTPLLPPAWWDGTWQSPNPRDVKRLSEYGVQLSITGEVDESQLLAHCRSREDHVDMYNVLSSDIKNSSTGL